MSPVCDWTVLSPSRVRRRRPNVQESFWIVISGVFMGMFLF
jgi:hypothetical protein